MGNLWFRMLARRSRRATWTIVGLALCAMYLTGTISLVGGLHETTAGIAGTFQQGPIVAYKGDNLLDSRISTSAIDNKVPDCAKVSITNVRVSPGSSGVVVTTYAVHADDPKNFLNLPEANLSKGSVIIGKRLSDRFLELGVSLFVGTVLRLSGPSGLTQVSVEAVFVSSALIPPDWMLISGEDIESLDSRAADSCSFVVLAEGDEPGRAELESIGLKTQNSMSVINFFEKGIYQIEQALWGLIGITSVIVGLLVYSTLSIEVGMRKPDIRLLKKMGAGPGRVAGLFAGRGVYFALCGAAIGVAAGCLAANVLISLAAARGLTTMIIPKADLFSVAIPFVIILLAGLVGAAIPSISAAREPMGGGAE
jgi:ABC-type lipoprotein release transport system permease subunit